MSVADLTLIVYGISALAIVFLAGVAWGTQPRVSLARRLLGAVFAAAAVLVVACYLVWNYDVLHRSFYVFFTGSVIAVVLAGWSLVHFSIRNWKTSGLLLILAPLGLLGLLAAGWSIVGREVIWPPFGYLSLCLLVSSTAAWRPAFRKGYQTRRNPELTTWAFLGLVGLLALSETLGMVRLMPGVRIYGRASLLHLFLSGILILGLIVLPRRSPQTAPAVDRKGGPIPWDLFNPSLSPREADLIEGLRQRMTNKELAAELGVGESTVKKHLVSVFRKAGVESRQELFEKLDRPV